MPVAASEKKTEPLTTWLPASAGERLRVVAERLGWSPSQFARVAIQSYLPTAERAAAALEAGREGERCTP